MSSHTYDKAVAQVLCLAETVLGAPHVQPRRLSLAAGMAPSSGYRALEAMEAQGMLSRDADGVYQRGARMLSVGLAAWGVGHLAHASPLVLTQLRRATGRTAALILSDGRGVGLGPVAFGRGAEFLKPPSPKLESEGRERILGQLALRSYQMADGRICQAICRDLGERAALALLLVAGDQPDSPNWQTALVEAAGRLAEEGK